MSDNSTPSDSGATPASSPASSTTSSSAAGGSPASAGDRVGASKTPGSTKAENRDAPAKGGAASGGASPASGAGTAAKRSAKPAEGGGEQKGGKAKWIAMGVVALVILGLMVAGIVVLNQRGTQASVLAESAAGAKAACEASTRADGISEKRIKVLEVDAAAKLAEAAKLKDPRYTQLADAASARARAAEQWDEAGLNNGADVQTACQMLADTNANPTVKP